MVYPLGDITDPVTGKKVVASQYRYVESKFHNKTNIWMYKLIEKSEYV